MTLPPDLLTPILAAPHDDLPRLVAADWLDENEQVELAEFIRLQIEMTQFATPHCSTENGRKDHCLKCFCKHRINELWSGENRTGLGYQFDSPPLESRMDWERCQDESGIVIYKRGFPDEIRCTMAQWVGEGPCRSCGSFSQSLGINAIDFCLTCRGTGLNGGIAGRVMAHWPVTTVVLTDRKPMADSSLYGWWSQVDEDHGQQVIHCEMWELLGLNIMFGQPPRLLKWYKTEPEANAALSAAAVHYGRRLAGLEGRG